MKHIFAAYFRNYLAVGILFGFLSGCSVIDPAEDIPSYLHIDSISLSALGNQGSSSSNISDAWVYMDGALVGAFQLPCNIPILAEGTHKFIISGGVKMNGLSSTRAIYPSWKPWQGELSLIRGQKIYINPTLTYYPTVDFVNNWMENFETAGISLIPESSSSGIIVKDSIPFTAEGNHSGYVHLNGTDTTIFIGASSQGYSMPPSVDTWIEFDYWSDAPFTVGIEKETDATVKIAWLEVEPGYAWKKIYVRLTDALAAAPQGVNYKIYFAMNNTNLTSELHLYLDNIKLLK